MKSSIFIVIVSMAIACGFASGEEKPTPSLAELKESATSKDPAKIRPTLEVAADLQKHLKDEKFEPDSEFFRKKNAYDEILNHLRNELLANKWTLNAPETEAIFTSLRMLTEKIDASIEEGYKWQSVSANVMPPLGTPNAASGMNPNAIQDPKLRQQYLDLIQNEQMKNLKNGQQTDLNSLRSTAINLAATVQIWAEQKGASREQIVEKLTPAGKSRQLLKDRISPPVETKDSGK